MGLKGYRLWGMGQLDSNVQSPATLKPRECTSSSLVENVPAANVAPEGQGRHSTPGGVSLDSLRGPLPAVIN
jgi:hypothetical protein